MPGSHSKKDKLKKKIAKVRKADQQDINRVKRWDSRSFNKKKELSGPTEPVFKTTSAIKPLTARPHPGMVGDELVASLRNRIARVKKESRNFGVTHEEKDKILRRKEEPVRDSHPKTPLLSEVPFGPKMPGGGVEYVNTYGKDLEEELKQRARHVVTKPHIKIRPPKPTQKQRARIIKARLAKIENYNAEADPEASAGEWINKYRKKRKNKIAKVRKATTRDDPSTPLLKEVPFGKDTRRKSQKEVDKEHLDFATSPQNIQKTHETKDWELEKPSQADRRRIIKAKISKIRKADGGVAPNYNNPSKVRKKKTATKAAATSKTGYLGDASVTIPWDRDDLGDLIEANVSFREMAQFHRRRIWFEGKGEYPQIWSLGKLTAEGQDARRIFDAAHDAEKRFVEEMGPEKYQKNMEQQIDHLNKEYGPDPDDDPDSMMNLAEAYEVDLPEGIDEAHKKVKKKERMARQRAAVRSAVNKGVNKVNPIKPTKKYKDTINPQEEDPDRIKQNATTVGRKPTYTGKIKKRIARIRKAGEQIDPRVKKRKTVRPNSPVQKVSQMKDRIAEMKIAKDHSHSIAFRKHEGQYYRRASLTKQEGKYAKYWLLNAKQMNGNGWGVSPTSIAKNINKFIGRPFVVTAKQWIPESEYGEQFEHPYLPTNNIDNIIHHQEKFRVGSIVDVVEKDGDYHAVIEMNSKFANMMLPPFCSPAIFQNNPGEADGEISDWEALHLAGLMEDPAYGARIALLKGSCMGTAEACSIQFKGAKLTKTMCPKKKAKLVRRIDRLGD